MIDRRETLRKVSISLSLTENPRYSAAVTRHFETTDSIRAKITQIDRPNVVETVNIICDGLEQAFFSGQKEVFARGSAVLCTYLKKVGYFDIKTNPTADSTSGH